MDGRTAFVTVTFISEQINVTRDKDGTIIDGDPDQPLEVVDIWTFARNTRSRNPNWTLIETRVPELIRPHLTGCGPLLRKPT